MPPCPRWDSQRVLSREIAYRDAGVSTCSWMSFRIPAGSGRFSDFRSGMHRERGRAPSSALATSSRQFTAGGAAAPDLRAHGTGPGRAHGRSLDVSRSSQVVLDAVNAVFTGSRTTQRSRSAKVAATGGRLQRPKRTATSRLGGAGDLPAASDTPEEGDGEEKPPIRWITLPGACARCTRPRPRPRLASDAHERRGARHARCAEARGWMPAGTDAWMTIRCGLILSAMTLADHPGIPPPRSMWPILPGGRA